jgi:hypothetical protein
MSEVQRCIGKSMTNVLGYGLHLLHMQSKGLSFSLLQIIMGMRVDRHSLQFFTAE